MITYKSLENQYGLKISKKFKVMLGDKINDNYCQTMLKKALKYNLSKAEHDNIFKVGSQSSAEFPGLYHLCFIYIHPLTYLQAIDKMAKNIERGIK
jgi:hypothetical protein